jgi:predicted alpha/beta superfamily hydrolase
MIEAVDRFGFQSVRLLVGKTIQDDWILIRRRKNLSASYPEVTIFHSETRTLTSSIVGQEYKISIWLPPSYSDSEKAYPVLYLLDGNLSFGLATDAVLALTFGQEIPELIIVGIGYPIQSYDDWGNNRNRDYTPTALEDIPGSGGAKNFLAFIETDLIPFVDKNYRTDQKDRAISGYSLGGLFVLYVLLSKPDLFNRYSAGSPSVNWDNRIIFQYEMDFASNRPSLPLKLFISVGSLEETERVQIEEFSTIFNRRSYDGLDFKMLVLEDETHLSGLAPAIARGIKVIFS